jgi:hypothetical protein
VFFALYTLGDILAASNSSLDPNTGSIVGQGPLYAIGLILVFVALALYVAVWIGGIVVAARLKRWGWLASIVMFSFFALVIFGVWGPRTAPEKRR